MAIFAGKFERVVFIVSSGRTGTTALAQHLDAAYPNVRALHEPRPSWRLRRASAKALCGRLAKPQLVELLASARRDLVSRITQPIYVESNPYLGGFLDAFGEVFDRPRILHVVRDPRSFIRSSINFGVFSGLKRFASACLPYWLPKPELCLPNPSCPPKTWRQMSPIERLAWYWTLLNTELNRGQSLYPHDYLRLRFEDLFNPDGTGLRQLTDFIGLPFNQNLIAAANAEKVNASKTLRLPKWPDWPADLQQQVLDHCRPLMTLYGYATEVQTTA